MEITKDTVNEALPTALQVLLSKGIKQNSRNGEVLAAPAPTTITYLNPCKRVLFNKERDANPFFHLMESMWMLAGRNDVEFPAMFAKNIRNYSDDGKTFYGAYGYRWRKQFACGDQLSIIADKLRKNPDDRQVVLAMWNVSDTLTITKDTPCNTHAYFRIIKNKLNLTVLNRSNDLIWGMMGANVVHFSVLLEYMARWLGLEVGEYYQISNNMHVYLDKYPIEKLEKMIEVAEVSNHYGSTSNTVNCFPMPLMSSSVEDWDTDLANFFEDPFNAVLLDPFMDGVVQPMYRAWSLRKQGATLAINDQINRIQAKDWRLACNDWLTRRDNANN